MGKLAALVAAKCGEIDAGAVDAFTALLRSSRRVYLFGAGRSGLVARAFGMRLMHLGFGVYIVGETITPAVRAGDALVAISGSGETQSVLAVARTAKERNVRIASITSNPASSLARLSDVTVVVKGREGSERDDFVSRQLVGEHEPMTPLGTLFELAATIFLEALVEELMVESGRKESYMKRRHANIE
jgi:6-phospho-3-hexuloisomerase